MVARVNTVAFQGIDVQPVDVQVQISSGVVAFNIVGLPDKAVAESKERVRAALHALGLSLPAKRLTVNLASADVAKEGSHYDLPIELAVPKFDSEIGAYVTPDGGAVELRGSTLIEVPMPVVDGGVPFDTTALVPGTALPTAAGATKKPATAPTRGLSPRPLAPSKPGVPAVR